MSEEVKVLATKANDLSLIFEFSMLERTGFSCLSLTSIYPPWCAHFTHTHFIFHANGYIMIYAAHYYLCHCESPAPGRESPVEQMAYTVCS